MWHEFWTAVALILVIEGLLPFASPRLMRQALAAMAAMDDRALRLSGMMSMGIGVALLYFVRA